MRTGRHGLAAAIVGNTLFAIGGWGTRGQTSPVVEAYDIEAGTWSSARSMERGSYMLAAAAGP